MKRVVFTGGGTGGHIYPALAIIKELRKRYPFIEVGYIGSQNGLEAKLVPLEENISFFSIDVQGLYRKLTLKNLVTVVKFIKSVASAKEYLYNFKPQVVVGTGGYVSGPAIYAAHKLDIPTMIHEQNVVLGLTTKFLAKFVNVVAVSVEETEKHIRQACKVIYTGNPRASEVLQGIKSEGKRVLGISDFEREVILIFGGSRGAKPINEAMIDMIPLIRKRTDAMFVYVTGEAHFPEMKAKLSQVEQPDNLKLFPFLHHMPDVLAAVNLVVARAGASTIAELTATGTPSILIPSPYVTNNHQERNARVLEQHGACKVILERDLSGQNLFDSIGTLLKDKEEILIMQQSAKRLGRPEAVKLIVDEIERIAVR